MNGSLLEKQRDYLGENCVNHLRDAEDWEEDGGNKNRGEWVKSRAGDKIHRAFYILYGLQWGQTRKVEVCGGLTPGFGGLCLMYWGQQKPWLMIQQRFPDAPALPPMNRKGGTICLPTTVYTLARCLIRPLIQRKTAIRSDTGREVWDI